MTAVVVPPCPSAHPSRTRRPALHLSALLALALGAGCDADAPPPPDTGDGTNSVSAPVFALPTTSTGGAAGAGEPANGAAGAAGTTSDFAGAGGGAAGAGGGAGGAAADAGAAPAAMPCPAGFECFTDPIFNLLSGCLPMGGGLPPECTTDADCVKAGLPEALCLMEAETGLTGCAQLCTP